MTSPAGPRDGVTLIELVFVAALLGVVLVAAAPNLRGIGRRLEAERAAFALAQTLRAARVLAVSQGRPIAWTWDPQARRAALAYREEDGSSTPVAGRLGRSRPVADEIPLAILREAEPVTEVVFAPDGTSQPTLLVVGGGTSPRYQVAVDETTGSVAVRSPGLPPH